MFVSNLLRSFIVTTRNKSLKSGAEQLYITKSPLSRRIKILEERLGCNLFLRGRDGVDLTHEGKELYDAISRYYDELTLLENHFMNKFTPANKPARSSHGYSISIEHCLHDCLSNLTHSQLRVISQLIYRDFNNDITQELLSGELDIIISNKELQYDKSEIAIASYKTATINIVKPKIKPLSQKSIIIPATLLNILDRTDINWRQELKKNLEDIDEAEVIITPEIKNHLSSIERGEVIGLISSQSLKPTDCKLNNIILCPLVINQHSVKIEIKIYFFKKKRKNNRGIYFRSCQLLVFC